MIAAATPPQLSEQTKTTPVKSWFVGWFVGERVGWTGGLVGATGEGVGATGAGVGSTGAGVGSMGAGVGTTGAIVGGILYFFLSFFLSLADFPPFLAPFPLPFFRPLDTKFSNHFPALWMLDTGLGLELLSTFVLELCFTLLEALSFANSCNVVQEEEDKGRYDENPFDNNDGAKQIPRPFDSTNGYLHWLGLRRKTSR